MKKILLLSLSLFLATLMIAQNDSKSIEINIATYNIAMDSRQESLNAWELRKDNVNGLIRFHDFDIMGTQEGFQHQLLYITEAGGYDYVGVGRDDGANGGEHAAIVYKKDRFDVLDKGDFWFSLTPEKPSFGWDAEIRRVCSWAKFRDKDSGKEFFVFNSHYDHQGKEARRNSSLLLLSKIKEIAGDASVFCVGDFNATPDDEPIQIIYDADFLKDSRLITQIKAYGTEGTWNGFDLDSPMNKRIDYIWVTPNITIKKYGVLNDMHYGRFPSDHFPVMVKASL